MQEIAHKEFAAADEVRSFPNGQADILVIGGDEVGRYVFQPGWRWSNDLKPIAKTDSCEAPHLIYCISGRMGIRMTDGTEGEIGPGDLASIAPGHDAWVVGDEPCIAVDFGGYSQYAKR